GDDVCGQADLQQLALHQRVVAVAGDADVREAVVDERAGPVVVGASNAVVAGEDLPEDGAGVGVERVPERVTTADVHHTVLHGRAGRHPRGHGVAAVGVGRAPQAGLPDHRPGGGVERVLEAVPGTDVRHAVDHG